MRVMLDGGCMVVDVKGDYQEAAALQNELTLLPTTNYQYAPAPGTSRLSPHPHPPPHPNPNPNPNPKSKPQPPHAPQPTPQRYLFLRGV